MELVKYIWKVFEGIKYKINYNFYYLNTKFIVMVIHEFSNAHNFKYISCMIANFTYIFL